MRSSIKLRVSVSLLVLPIVTLMVSVTEVLKMTSRFGAKTTNEADVGSVQGDIVSLVITASGFRGGSSAHVTMVQSESRVQLPMILPLPAIIMSTASQVAMDC